MAINPMKEKVVLKLELDGGMVDGKQKIISKSFSKVKTDALDDNLHATATSIAGLQENGLLNVKKIETTDLVEA